jgi:general stress protein 26
MEPRELMDKAEALLEESKAGVLATVDEIGRPHMRWMTPRRLKGRTGTIYALTTAASAKAFQLGKNVFGEWLIQSKTLSEIVTLKGNINMLDHPSLKNEVMEALGSQLTVFWKVNPAIEDFVVLETVVEEGTYFMPMKGIRETIKFRF